ncbi:MULTISPECIES: IS5 family transposase [unclassified Corallococcus]|uniref:IS5 family transposase n=1 Tax=unclassified Corallococcus TaxID=2685029 RepID=UPI001A8E2E13|nr:MULTISPECIES: IS5 family transposase [unclassified Corallococcus]MBN9683433.1 IS5 family transposase [Corallococcus sp. NCSPR001]WAS85050.1 IS5 family transposase [Corallococcus sp. NCRR]
MMRYELNERQWRALAPLLPHQGRGGAWSDHRSVLNGILWRLHTGAPWRDLPSRYGPWQTVYDRFVRWRKDGTWLRLMHTLQAQLRAQDELDMSVLFVDSTVVRATRAAAGGGKRGARTSPKTTPWGARAGAFPPSSTSPVRVTATCSPSP